MPNGPYFAKFGHTVQSITAKKALQYWSQKQLAEPQKSSTNFDFDKAKETSSNEHKVDQIGRLFEDKNPIKRIPTQVIFTATICNVQIIYSIMPYGCQVSTVFDSPRG